MKANSFIQTWVCGVRRAASLGLGLIWIGSGQTAHGASAAEVLEKAIYAEETKGELKAAAQFYQQVVDDPAADQSLMAQAQLRLGLCQLKLGNKPQAMTALDRLTRYFPDQDKLLAVVEQHMPQLLDEIVRQIEQNYIQEVDRGELMETAIRAILGKLDARHGYLRTNDLEFLGADELKQFNIHLEQKVAGIGAVLNTNDGAVVVQMPMAGSPALDAGLRAGDRIVTIDGTALPPNQLKTAVDRLRGPVGTPVTLGIKRSGAEAVQEIRLVRNTIRLPSISGDHRQPDSSWDFMLDEPRGIAYIRLGGIGQQSAAEMRTALDGLQARGMKGVIFDLRNAPGGLLDGAVAISDLFVENGRIVTVKGRSSEKVYDAKPEETFTGFPIALLVNRNTASAAEIIAACLQDHHRAVVIGERTFGQGIVRSIFQLKDGVGAMKLPVAAYFRPSGKAMNRFPDSEDSDDWGVSPDAGYEVTLTDDELKQYEKDRASRDALSGEATSKAGLQDRQLQKALEFIRGQLK
jgi:carboxyl-terminal processing protease